MHQMSKSAEMPIELTFARPVALPAQSLVTHAYQTLNLSDAFAIRLPTGASGDPALLARFIFSHQPAWIGQLTNLRDMIVVGLGLKTARQLTTLANDPNQTRLGIFKVYSTTPFEIVVGEDDKHLDFRVSVMCSEDLATENGRRLTISTVVHCHNLLGRVYLFVIAPFHRLVVKASLRRAARVGWPADPLSASSHLPNA
jgi:hypothetical protein